MKVALPSQRKGSTYWNIRQRRNRDLTGKVMLAVYFQADTISSRLAG